MPSRLEISAAYARLTANSEFLPPERILDGTGLLAGQLDDLEFVDWTVLATMFNNIEDGGVDAGWTARLGSRFNIASHGPLGFAALSAPTLGESLRVMGSYYPARNSGIDACIVERDDRFCLEVVDLTGDPRFAGMMDEVVSKIVESLLATILGHPVSDNVLIEFQHAPRRDEAALRSLYDARLAFNCPRTGVSVPSSWQHLPCPLRDETNYRANVARLRDLIAERDKDSNPRRLVRARLAGHFDRVLSGESLDASPPTQADIASSLHVTVRTLIRRLQAHDTSYKVLLEEVRREYAERLLRDARYTVAQVGEMLGYREPANFGRAFRRWYGMTPAAWRRQG